MDEDQRVDKIIERRNKRRDSDEESMKLDREVTERDTDSTGSRFEELVENMSPEQAAEIMDEIEV